MMDRQWYSRKWWLWVLVLLTLGGCRALAAPLPGEQRNRVGLVQPLTLEEIYRATPAVAQRPLRIVATPIAAPTPDVATLVEAGEVLYTVNCAPCHQDHGQGVLDRFPALNQNAFVTNQSPAPLIRTVLYGRGIMPAFTPTLNDQEIAAILTYIRQAWNNDADAVMPSRVREVATTEGDE